MRPRIRLFALGILAISVVTATLHQAPVCYAQDEGFGQQAQPAADDSPKQTEEDASKALAKNQTWLSWAYTAMGAMYSIAFLLLSVCLVALLIVNLLYARRDNVCPKDLIDQFEAKLNDKAYQDAYNLAKNDDSFLGQVLSAGLEKLQVGYAQSIEAMQEVGEEENMKLEHRLSYLALIGTISPMVGLLGTVQGMIESFQVIAFAGTTPKASELAAGISKALVTTLFGLFIAIPAIALHNILKNRISRLVLEVGIMSERLMSRFQNVGKKKDSTPTKV